MADIQKLEQELRAITKERDQVEKNWRDIEYKERQTEQIAKRRAQPTKRTRDTKTDADDETDGKRLKNDEEEDDNVKQAPKLTSAIVAPVSAESEEAAKSSANKPSVVDKKEVTRQRKMFGVLLGTLQQFKNESTRKSDAVSRREQLEHKIDAKVKEEQETFVERERRTIQEQKDKVAAKKEELKRKQEEKELELLSLKWQTHRSHLSNFIRTEAKPHIYYRAKTTSQNKESKDAKDAEKDSKREEENNE